MDLIHNGEKRGEIIWKVRVGSHAYGTNIQGSDEDFKGLYFQDPVDILNRGYQEQVEVSKDECYYEIRRFLDLACGGNPTMMEILWSPEDCIIYKHPIMDELLANRDKLLSKSCRHTYSGYAIDQIKKASGLNKKMNWAKEDMVRKTLLDFCYVYKDGESIPLKTYLKKENKQQKFIGLTSIPHWRYGYKMYYDHIKETNNDNPKMRSMGDFDFQGVVRDEEKSMEVVLSEVPEWYKVVEGLLYCNKDEFHIHCKKFKSYETWLKERNVQRYVDVESHGQKDGEGSKIDCYLDSETEFLTVNGWKKYYGIKDDEEIASVNKTGKIVFSNFIDRHYSSYSGDIYTYENRYSKFSVTPNHNLLLRYLNRNSLNNFKGNFKLSGLSNFEYIPIQDFLSKRKNYSRILHVPLIPFTDKEYNLSDEEISILGAYISDGHLCNKRICIDQKENKGLYNFLESSNFDSKIKYTGSYTGEEYLRYSYKNHNLVQFIKKNIGEGSLDKFLSPVFYQFSKRQLYILLKHMVWGDGHSHPKGHSVYYTSSKKLAEDLQTLLFLNSITSQIYTVNHKGGFENSSSVKYQVMISKKSITTGWFNKHENWSKKTVRDEGICCFTTLEGNLVTRNSHKIAIQGNSKNLLHCVRLVEMGLEIARGEGINVRRPNAEYLIEIRKGKHDLKSITDRANKSIDELAPAFESSTLPDKADRGYFMSLMVKMRKEYYKGRIFFEDGADLRGKASPVIMDELAHTDACKYFFLENGMKKMYSKVLEYLETENKTKAVILP